MGNGFTRLVAGLKYGTILGKTAVLQTWSKDISRRYLLDSLGSIPGISAKVAQLLASKLGQDAPGDPIKISPMPISMIKAEIESKNPALAAEIDEISEIGLVASLGQVHAAKLKSGEQVAIKVQYPNLQQGFLEGLEALRQLSRVGPPRRFFFETDLLIDYFEKSLLRELDYRIEATQQREAKDSLPPQKPIVIAKVYPEYTQQEILVQSFEPSLSLNHVAKNWTESRRRIGAQSLLEYFIGTLCTGGLLHTDPHPGNFGFREKTQGLGHQGQGVELVLYDFGSMMRIERHQGAILWQLMEAYRKGDDIVPFDAMVALGFDPQKLLRSAKRLPSLVQKLMEPYARRRPFDFNSWNLKKHFERVLGEDRWWFRSAGPAWFLMLIRSAHGFIHGISQMKVLLPVQDIVQGLKISCEKVDLKPTLAQLDSSLKASTRMMAKKLSVSVDDTNGKNIVALELPFDAVDEIESFIPEESLAKIMALGVDLPAIKSQVQRSGYMPQKVFEAKIENRIYRVWLK